jgi:hypothetical protein
LIISNALFSFSDASGILISNTLLFFAFYYTRFSSIITRIFIKLIRKTNRYFLL